MYRSAKNKKKLISLRAKSKRLEVLRYNARGNIGVVQGVVLLSSSQGVDAKYLDSVSDNNR